MRYQIGDMNGGFKIELDKTGFNVCLWLKVVTIVFDIIRRD